MTPTQRSVLMNSAGGWSRISGVVPSLDLDFAHNRAAIKGKPMGLAGLLSWSNASTTFVTTSDGRLISIAANTPRISDQGALIEQGSTNLALQSQTFDNASWTKTRSSITTSSWTAPDGTSSGETLVEDSTASNTHFVSQNITKAASALAYTFSVYAKSGTRTRIALQMSDNAGNGVIAVFDLSGQQVGVAAAGVGTPFTSFTTAVQAYPNGVTRCILTATSNTATTLQPAIFLDSGSGTGALSNSYSGNGTSGAFVWGSQVEQVAFPTSYIATTTGSVARNADAVTLAALASGAFSTTFPLSVYCRVVSNPTNSTAIANIFAWSDGTANNREAIFLSAGASMFPTIVQTVSGTAHSVGTANSIAPGGAASIAGAFNTNDGAIAANGGATAAQATFAQPSGINAYQLGANGAAGAQLNGYLSRLAVFSNQRIGNGELTAMSGH